MEAVKKKFTIEVKTGDCYFIHADDMNKAIQIWGMMVADKSQEIDPHWEYRIIEQD